MATEVNGNVSGDGKLLGRVTRIIRSDRGQDRGYGFIVTDDRITLFFHQADVIDNCLPEPSSLVTFNRVKQTAKNMHDRAVNIEIVSLPAA